MSHDEFTKLFKYMQREFKSINDRLDQTASKSSLDRLTNLVDAYAKRSETYHQDMLVLNHQVNRHDGWIHELAETTGTELSP
ncbi:MAG TPA: hypothetical protein VIJ68_02985 [Candidatus Saccharimonadales bacterium]